MWILSFRYIEIHARPRSTLYVSRVSTTPAWNTRVHNSYTAVERRDLKREEKGRRDPRKLFCYFLSWKELSGRNWQTFSEEKKSPLLYIRQAYYTRKLTLAHSSCILSPAFILFGVLYHIKDHNIFTLEDFL